MSNASSPMMSGQDLARIQSVISRPAATRVAGPRLASLRRWAGIVIMGAAIGMPLQSIVKDSGVMLELAGAVNPAATIESAPEQLKWVSLPSSPFLDAGYQADGSFSLEKMAQAWQRAGLAEEDVQGVAQKMNDLRPVLMGREDPVLEAQLIANAAQAANELQASFPEVHSYLKSGQENPNAVRWEDGPAPVEALLSNPLPIRDWTLQVRIEKALEWNQSPQGQRAPLEIPDILLPAITPEGVSMDRLVDAWKQSGMSPEQAYSAVELAKMALPVTQGLSSDNLFPVVMKSHTMNLEIKEQFAPFLSSLSSTTQEGQDVSGEPGSAQTDASWERVETRAKEWGDTPSAVAKGLTFAEAVRSLESAVQTTGLRSLSLSLDAWQSPDTILRSSQRLEKVNAQLEQVTGWEGKVLGLDGRVELSLGRPVHQEEFAGVVRLGNSAQLEMHALWRNVGHEWFHAFDAVASRYSLTHSTILPMSENMQPMRQVSIPHVHTAMKEALRSAHEDTPVWKENRESLGRGEGRSYWTSPAEVMANGFEALLSEVHQADTLVSIPTNRGQRNFHPAKGPSSQEAAALEKPFQALFDAAGTLGLAGAPQSVAVEYTAAPAVGSVSEWRAQRSAGNEVKVKVPVQVSHASTFR